MKTPMIALVVGVLVLSAGVLPGCSSTPSTTPSATSVSMPGPSRVDETVEAEAKVVPVRSANLGITMAGTVSEVPVLEGNVVEAGQVLVKLESSRQSASVMQAEAGLKRAQAQLDQLKAGARTQELAAAKAVVEAAEAQLAKLRTGARAEDIAAAEAAVAAGNSEKAAAEATLAALQGKPKSEDVRAAELAVEQARGTLWAAQIERDGACGISSESYQCKAADAKVGAAWTGVNTAGETLKKVQQPASAEDVKAAQEAVAGATSGVSSAQAALDAVRRGPLWVDVAAGEAEVRRAQAQYDLVQAGSRPETIAAAEADVLAAQGALQAAKAALADTEIKAPFRGTVVTLGAKVGEQVAAGMILARLADVSMWQIETTDLTELSIVNVKVGDSVVVTFDAITGLELPGKVAQVKMLGESTHGDITYTVLVTLDRLDERLKWNMTASVSIQTK